MGKIPFFEGGKDGIKKESGISPLGKEGFWKVEIVVLPRVVVLSMVIYDTVHLFLHPSLLYV